MGSIIIGSSNEIECTWHVHLVPHGTQPLKVVGPPAQNRLNEPKWTLLNPLAYMTPVEIMELAGATPEEISSAQWDQWNNKQFGPGGNAENVLLMLSPVAARGAVRFNRGAAKVEAKIRGRNRALDAKRGFDFAYGFRIERTNRFPIFKVTDFPNIKTKISQKQLRHVKGRPEYSGGGYFDNAFDAQAVLDAFHSGAATIIGKTKQGFPVVRYDDVTGTNVNEGAGFPEQSTNIFIIKGTTSPSVVPTNPNWRE